MIETGFLNKKEEEIRLYRIMDISLQRPLGQRLWGLGTVHLCTADRSTPELDIRRVKKSKVFKEMLSDLVEKEREAKRITAREFMGGIDGDHDHDDFDGIDMDEQGH